MPGYYTRVEVLAGEELSLKAVLVDETNQLINADAIPQVYIYDSTVELETIQEEIDDQTYTSALAGPLVATFITTGFYEYVYTVPNGSPEGTWRDVWVANVNTVEATQILQFQVVADSEFQSQGLAVNTLIVIELESAILDEDGNALEPTQISFSTVYDPFYASPDLVRLELGPIIDYIPDDTLALMIHWASMEADFLAKPHKCNQQDFEFARTKFVVFSAACKAIMLPGGAGAGAGGTSGRGKRKSLGDLSIDNGATSSTVPVLSSGVDQVTFQTLKDLRDEWARVVNAGGCIVPGQSIESATGRKSKYDEGRRTAGRLWESSSCYSFYQPSVNTKRATNRSVNRRFVFDPYPYSRTGR